MSTETPAKTPAAKGAAARPKRPEGQWALGEREPLNENEAWKAREGGLAVRERILSTYAEQGFASIPGEDLRGRMRWWGLYTQRKPGIDGGRTASLEPHELDDEYFMLRVRIDGGAVTVAQLRTLAEISQRFARGTADITDRQNIQYHWIRVEDMPEIWDLLAAARLSTTEACGDTPRVVLGSPLAGIAADEIIDGTPAIKAIVKQWVGDPTLANLPRKFKTAVSGSPHQDVAHEIHDIAFVGVNHPEHGPGFDLWVGGGLSTNPMLAQRLGTWVPLDEVPEVWHGVIQIFRDYGYRRLRTRARLKFLMADWGPEKFRQVLEDEYLKRPLLDGPAPVLPTTKHDHVGVHRQKNGKFYVGATPVVGRISGSVLEGLADAMEKAGSNRLRFTPQQKLVVLDVTAKRVADLLDDLDTIGLTARPSIFRRGTMACTGIEFCKLAITATKSTATTLVNELETRLADVPELFTLDGPSLTINMNGCPNSCARAQIADIGLKGIQVPNPDDPQGPTVEGFQIHLGGGLGVHAGFGRKLRGLKTSSADLPDYVERVVRRWLKERDGEETFASWVLRADDEAIR
ncbi:nitrite/sulfite reductase [Spongisporangium articulatum]|uniref:assimilatory sulfite reductase (ferredoxin) n=1 Tax=Spongisporangium articulatum TaxID=3362603 RepID=A0ABW8AQ22_9ACTN